MQMAGGAIVELLLHLKICSATASVAVGRQHPALCHAAPQAAAPVAFTGKLYVDGLNIAAELLVGKDSWGALVGLPPRTERFVRAAREAGIELAVFLDSAVHSDETRERWRRRKQSEVKLCTSWPQTDAQFVFCFVARCSWTCQV